MDFYDKVQDHIDTKNLMKNKNFYMNQRRRNVLADFLEINKALDINE